ncbi:unnamed protein product [Anisakis simplex]|uniref:Uncharacterized protein n=1 Tax=Anisakis simplex TaxID=6269 RepID=A0A158PNS4_ANISI|nr:unnamed protein product [Anisakis simplex]
MVLFSQQAVCVIFSVLLSIALQSAHAFLIQCECQCIPDYCSKTVPRQYCPCATADTVYQGVPCNPTISSAPSNIIIYGSTQQQQQQQFTYPVVITQQNPFYPQITYPQQTPLLTNSNPFYITISQQPSNSINTVNLGSLGILNSYQQQQQQFTTGTVTLRIPQEILNYCQPKQNPCPLGEPNVQVVDNCTNYPNTQSIRCITVDEIRRLFICV